MINNLAFAEENQQVWFPTRFDTIRPVQSLKKPGNLRFGFKEKRIRTFCEVKRKTLISFAVTATLVCVFVFA